MKSPRYACVWLIVILLSVAGSSGAQVPTGTPAFNSFGGGPFDVVNLGNLNVHFSIPILTKAGRGLQFKYELSYDSSIWYPVGTSGNQTWQPVANWGWQSPYGGGAGYLSNSVTTTYCHDQLGHVNGTITTISAWKFHDQWGVVHAFTGQLKYYSDGAPQCTGTDITSLTSTATDGSGLVLNIPTGGGTTVTAPSGRVYTPAGAPPTGPTSTTVTDTNGNQITQANVNGSGVFTDTLGQAALTVGGTNPVTLQYTPPNGTPVSYRVNYQSFNVKTNFACSGIAQYTATNVLLVSSITLPDNTSYTFNYEPTQGFSGYVTGRLKSVSLPTGGTINYSYPLDSTGTKNAITCADGSAPTASGSNPSMTRTLNPGGQWTYARTQVSGNHWQTKVSTPPDPQNQNSVSDDTVIDFQKDSATTNNTSGFYETQRQTYQGASGTTLLLTTVTCYNGNTSACTTTAVSSPITNTSMTLQYPNNGLQSKTVTTYNGYGLVTEVDKYAYASGPPTVLAQKTQIAYASLSNNIVDRPLSVTVTDGSSNLLSKTTYNYDEAAYPTQPTTGTPQHVSISGSRGNATTITRFSTPTASLVSHLQYYDTGTPYKSYDVNGAVTSYTYGTATQGNSTISCGNSFPTSVTLPITGLSTSTAYDCVGGVVLTSTDLNGKMTTTTYNDTSFWRPASVTDPTSATANLTYTAYNSGTQAPANVDSKMLFNGGSSVVERLATIGGFGQMLYSQQREGPASANYDSTQAIYDSFLRPYQSTMPCVTTAGQGCPTAAKTTRAFDALGRVLQTTDGGGGYVQSIYNQNDVKQIIGPAPTGENLKQKQLEYDALGRLTSVCEITSLTGYVTCGQTTTYNGYWTTYAYSVVSGNPTVTVNQNKLGATQQTRVYTYDLLGRLISEKNPETNNLARTYTYDSDSSGTCSGAFPGNLVKVVDAKSNNICYQYDSIHRVLQITYPSGPDAGSTPAKTFVYDAATFNGTAMSNAKGRLAEAYTGPSASKTTDEFFSYSVRGEKTDAWECTPHSGTNGCVSVSNYYHVTAGFWANGALQSLTSNVSGLPSQTYGVDSMGRTASVTAGSGQNPVTSIIYDLANFKTTVNYGSLDSDINYFDPNTGRMTKYVFNVGSNSDTGITTWNPNGSLATLAITNTIPGTSDTQTCSYTHDDLLRISTVGCVNGATNKWNQGFSYDPFGNITKTSSGPGISFQPNYDATKNWITSLPGSITTTTDANGQVTYDGTHNYAWDAEGKMLSVDTTTMTHDALGRLVEKNVSGTYTQVVYGPTGRKFALMNGQTLQKGYVPLPGAQAVYTSTGLTYYRHADHLGSSRLATTPSRTLYSSTAYAPYGEAYAQSGTPDLSFTGQDQDVVAGMHDFLLRKFVPVQGRWLSPDPGGLGAVDPGSPQSWNRYAYVLSNPLAMIDALGDDGCYDADSTCEGGSGYGMLSGLVVYQSITVTASLTAADEATFAASSTDGQLLYAQLPTVGGGPGSINIGGGGSFPNLPPFTPPAPQKGFCSLTANVGSASPQAQQAIQQTFNQAGVGIDFVNGAADLSVMNVSLPIGELGVDQGLLGELSSTAIVDQSQLSGYPSALGSVISHEWGHYLIGCYHRDNPLMATDSCGMDGLMSPGWATAHRGLPMAQWNPQNRGFQFTGQDQFDAIQNKCKSLHPTGN